MNALRKFLFTFSSLLLTMTLMASVAKADTSARQFQLSGGLGVFFVGGDVANGKGVGTSFDLSVEPEFFFSEHTSLAFRFDLDIGNPDSANFEGRFRYYFDFDSHPRFNLYVGAGIGGLINFDGPNFGALVLPLVGWQYDVTEQFKIGSDLSPNILFNGDDMSFGLRLQPVVVKWAF